MSREQNFEKLDELAEGLRDISGLPNEEQEKTPEHKKWKAAIDSLPKEERKKYYDRAYQKSREERMKEEKAKEPQLNKLFEKEIRPKTNIIHFWLGNKIVKEEKLEESKETITDIVLNRNEEEREAIQNIGVPELVDIDYSEVKNIEIPKNGAALKPYKDGFLIVRDDNPKAYQYLEISDYTHIPAEKFTAKIFFHLVIFNGKTNYFFRADDEEKVKKYKDNLSFYIVFKKAYKNKAFKITLKNNVYLKHVFQGYETQKEIFKRFRYILTELPAEVMTNYVEAAGVLEQYEKASEVKKQALSNPEAAPESFDQDNFGVMKFSKEKLLKTGYHYSILTKFMFLLTAISSILKNATEEDFKKTIMQGFKGVNPKDFKTMTKNLVSIINEHEYLTKENLRSFVEEGIITKRFEGKKNKVTMGEIAMWLIDLTISHKHTEGGTSLPFTGKIDVENASEIDCLYYWNYVNLFSLVNGCLGEGDFPLLLDEGKICNENKIVDHVYEFQKTLTLAPFRTPNETLDMKPETKNPISEILKEAMEQTTGLLIPYNACVGLKDDPIFKYIRFIEYEKYIAIFAHDENDRYLPELYVKGEDEFRYWLYNSGQVSDPKVDESAKLLYLKLAACIRDWKVLIERDSNMSYQGRRIPSGVKSSKPRQMYLPRVTYKRSNSVDQKRREKVFFNENRKFSGERRAHRRKLKTGMKASKLQMLLAETANIYIPDGYTFVRKSIWGKIKKSKREIKYRTTSLNGLFYGSDTEIKKARTINDLGPGDFEEFSEKYITKLGWEVVKRNNYDGGIDIRAFKEFKDGTIKKLLVQCKHPAISKKPIGPDVIRGLIGSSKLEESKHEKVLMVITSSKFTYGAREAAEQENIELIDGDELLK